MPRDKTESHEKIVQAAMREFKEKGFEIASMKSIADATGMTAAALYRHFVNKQDMFAALVEPALAALTAWKENHVRDSYEALNLSDYEALWRGDGHHNDISMVLDVMYAYPDAFYLLLRCSTGTQFETYLHDVIEENTDHMMAFLDKCREMGFPAKTLQRDEMHMLITAYVSALVQPIEHSYAKSDAERYLKRISDFFMKGWQSVAGLL